MTEMCKGFTILNILIRFLASMCCFLHLVRTVMCKQRVYHIVCIHRDSLLYEYFHDHEGYRNFQRLYNLKYIHKVSLQNDSLHAFEDDCDVKWLHLTDWFEGFFQSIYSFTLIRKGATLLLTFIFFLFSMCSLMYSKITYKNGLSHQLYLDGCSSTL